MNDEDFPLLPNAAKLQLTNDACPSKKMVLQQIIPIKVTCSSNKLGFEPEKVLDNDYFSYWKGNDGLPAGESLTFAVPTCYPLYVDILFKEADKRTVTCAVLTDAGKNFHGSFPPTKNDKTPVRVVLVPTKTNIIKVRTDSYEITSSEGTYPNPEIAEVRVIGYVENPTAAQGQPYFVEPPQGYFFPPNESPAFGYPVINQKFITPTKIYAISAIIDKAVVDLNNHKGDINAVENVIKLPYDDKWSGKGVGSSIVQEFDQSDLKKFKNVSLLRGFTFRAFQCPPRSYRLLIRIFPDTGIQNLDSSPTVYQKIINLEEGMGESIHVDIDPNLYNDIPTNRKKTLAITMLDTNNPYLWFSIFDFYATGVESKRNLK